MTQFFSLAALREKIESFWPKKLSHLSWDENILIERNIYCIGYPTDNGQSSIIAKVVNKQNTSKLLLYKVINYILKWFWKWFQNHSNFKVILIFKSPLINYLDFDFKSPLFRWFDFDFKVINIWWFCPSLV